MLVNSAKPSEKSFPISTVKSSTKESVKSLSAHLTPKTLLKNKTNFGINSSKSNPDNSNLNATPNRSMISILKLQGVSQDSGFHLNQTVICISAMWSR